MSGITSDEYLKVKRTMESLEKFIMRIPESGCWIWVGALRGKGYGYFQDGNKAITAHRWFYIKKYGAIPDGLVIDHICNIKCCVNPDHMRATTHKVNILRGTSFSAANSKKTHCPKGHPLDKYFKLKSGAVWRSCKTCEAAYKRRYRARRNHHV